MGHNFGELDMVLNRRNRVLVVLMLVYLLSFLDRQIITILAEDIKEDLSLTDTQLGLLTGFSFALFYGVLGLPIARLAEQKDRVTILTYCMSIWSLMTSLGALATNYTLLALTRAGVGIGEAGSVAPAHSIIGDMFDKKERSRAMAIFQLGAPLGILSGFFIGGILSPHLGWRMTLIVVGIPGLLLAPILRYAIKDPRQLMYTASNRTNNPPLLTTAKALFSHKGYILTLMGATLASAAGYAILSFLPSYLIRHFYMETTAVGIALSLIVGIGGGLGLYIGGLAADWSAKRSHTGPLWICAGSTAVSAPLFAIVFLGVDQSTIFYWLIPPFFLHLAWMGPNWAMVQLFAPKDAKTTASALVLLSINLFGLGVGPLLIGLLSDYLTTAGVPSSLGYALLIAPVMLLGASVCYALATRFSKLSNDVPEAYHDI